MSERAAGLTGMHERGMQGTLVSVTQGSLPRVAARGWQQTLRRRALVAVLVLSDVALAAAIWSVAYLVQIAWGSGQLTGVAASAVPSSIVAWIGLRAILGLYPGYGLDLPERLRRHSYSVAATLALTSVFAVAYQFEDLLSRLLLLVGFAGILLAGPFATGLSRLAANKMGLWGKPVVVVGSGTAGTEIVDLLRGHWQLGYRPAALFQYLRLDELSGQEESASGEERSGVLPGAITEFASHRGVDTLVLAMPHTRHEQTAPLVRSASTFFRHVIVIPHLSGITNSAVVARDFAGTFGVEIKHNLLDPWSCRVKRSLDLVGAVVVAVLLAPVLLMIAACIKLDSPGPVFYGHRRIGAGGRHFRCWKFRTMRVGAEEALKRYLRENPALREEWERNYKLQDDPRITRAGAFLRKTSLDELPQLWNVLCGEMSMVGPRPMLEAEAAGYGETYELYERVAPGMTGFWQVNGRSDTSYEERVSMNAYYVRNWSVWLDLIILVRTVDTVLLSRGAR